MTCRPPRPLLLSRRDGAGGARGFSLVELLISASLVALVAGAGVMYVARGTAHADATRDRVFARQKALSILEELRSRVQGGGAAADLDRYDDGGTVNPTLTTATLPGTENLVAPDHVLSENVADQGTWRFARRVTISPFPGTPTRDLRVATVRVFRMRPGEEAPTRGLAESSIVIRSNGDTYPMTQVYDLYLLALENVPGWWVNLDAVRAYVESSISDLQTRNPGLAFRTHWITRVGYGRDQEYAPYTNEVRTSTDATPWAYVYPGRMPAGSATERYYAATTFGARMNRDGVPTPAFAGGYEAPEGYDDENGNGRFDEGEAFTDADADGLWDRGNPVPYALADMHNHAMRRPEEDLRHQARVAAQLEGEGEPTWRMLLDDMVREPARYHNAILVNLHGELLPMPPVRNISDAAKDPEALPGVRAVTHPELLRPRRTPGNDALTDEPRFRVYAWKTQFPDTRRVTPQAEPYEDVDGDGKWDTGEWFEDWDGDGERDEGQPITLVVPGDFSASPNAASNPSILIQRLAGGLDADGDGSTEEYTNFTSAAILPERFTDTNKNGVREVAEAYLDLNGNGTRDDFEPWQEIDGTGDFTTTTEALDDRNANGRLDLNRPVEAFTDSNGNGRWDAAEPYWDYDGNGVWTPPTSPKNPWIAWKPSNYGKEPATKNHVKWYGEPFLDRDGDRRWDAAEPLRDMNGNGVFDGGFERGEMWAHVAYDAALGATVVTLDGTPLETPATSSRRGLDAAARLYDLDYVPCPTPDASGSTDRFGRNLSVVGTFPKNTARWTVELPTAALRRAYETAAGRNDGDAADRVIEVQTRIGRDLTTGTMWPVRHKPANRSSTYAYFYANAGDVPYSERFQFQGDPRHCPYADLDRSGTTSRDGYNWYFDSFQTDGDARSSWPAFDTTRLRARWLGRSSLDVGRYMAWLRTALTKSEAVYSTLTGFSYFYMSVGGDVGYDSANGYDNSIPMDGLTFGRSGDVFESTITSLGTSGVAGGVKHVRTNSGSTSAGIRSNGCWWSKPWLGELCPDTHYASQWATLGNLRAGTAGSDVALIRRSAIPTGQQPDGTRLYDSIACLQDEGCTSFFNVGSSGATFHHQYADGRTGKLVEDGPSIALDYNFPVPTTTGISRPFGLAVNTSGGTGDEFNFSADYPRFTATLLRRYYDHQDGRIGSAVITLREPGGARGAHVVVNGLDRMMESGSAFIARYSLVSVIHSFFAAGVPGTPNRVKQLPRVQILAPTLVTELRDPEEIAIRWQTGWTRWDQRPYTASYTPGFLEAETDVVYVPMYSTDDGRTWRHVLDDSPAEPGSMPTAGGAADPARTLSDAAAGADETLSWPVPAARFPEGWYLLRIEAYRASEALHYAQHMEKFYVYR